MAKNALGVVRLSHLTEETTSPERQRAHVENAAQSHGATIIDWAEDLDISASKFSPFKRPDLGPWLLKPELMARFDILLYWRLDRFVRSARDFREILSWCDTHGKIIQSATEPMLRYDPNATGFEKAISEIIGIMGASFAEMDSDSTTIRTLDTRDYLRKAGYYQAIPTPPFGYVPEKVITEEGKERWTLVHSELTYPIRREIIDRLLNGESRSSIAHDFNHRGLAPPTVLSMQARGKTPKNKDRAKAWTTDSFSGMFDSDAPLGVVLHKGEPVLDETTGLPIKAYEPLMTRGELQEIRQILKSDRNWTRNPKCPIAGIVFCLECNNIRYHMRNVQSGRTYDYMRCSSHYDERIPRKDRCPAASVRVDEVMMKIEEKFLSQYGDAEAWEYVYHPAEDHTDELEEATGALEVLLSQAHMVSSERAQAIFAKQIASLEKKITGLEQLPIRNAGFTPEGIGKTNREIWESSDWNERRELLNRENIKVWATRKGKDTYVRIAANLPELASDE